MSESNSTPPPPGPEGDSPPAAWNLAACLAVVLPTLLVLDLPPSATFANQAAAFIGWGVFAFVFAATPGLAWRAPWRSSEGWLLGALALLGLAAAAAPLWAGLPWTLALSSVATLLATAFVAIVGAAMVRAGRGASAFESLSLALLVAGVLGAAIGIVQIVQPAWADGRWIAAITAGRAAGNLRQPNHLSSLLLWSLVALVWLHDRERIQRGAAIGFGLLLLAGVVLTGSRTGTLGVLMLAAWGLLDRRLSPAARRALMIAPVVYALLWAGLGAWAHSTQHEFGGDAQLAKGDISSSRFAIWSNTLTLIARHPWLGVGWGEFNFAWSLTPFPDRPVAFFDHTHNLPLQFAVELGLPLAALVLALLGRALWCAWRAGLRSDQDPATGLAQRAAFLMVLMMAVHSQLEYPLWYAYFLLPTAFAFGLCLGKTEPVIAAPPSPALRAAAAAMVLAGLAAVYDYHRVVVIYAPGASAPPLAERIAEGRHSVLFGHHADYAALTTEAEVADPTRAFARATHYLLDTRLMLAWARALEADGQADAARHVAARLREFRNPQSLDFFEVCDLLEDDVDDKAPFQCHAASAPPDFNALRR